MSVAYPAFPIGAPLFARFIEVMIPGPYRLRGLEFETVLTASNKGTYVAYRGPWAVETWVRERMMDVLARQLGISRAEIRLRNMIGPDELPAKMVTGPSLDVRMSARATLEKALELADFAGLGGAEGGGARRGPVRRVGLRHLHRGGARAAWVLRLRHARDGPPCSARSRPGWCSRPTGW